MDVTSRSLESINNLANTMEVNLVNVFMQLAKACVKVFTLPDELNQLFKNLEKLMT